MRRESPYTNAAVERMMADMRDDGVPLSRSAVMHAVEEPHWDTVRSVHDWRSYIPPSLRRSWDDLPLAARLRLFEVAELVALDEETGGVMVTGGSLYTDRAVSSRPAAGSAASSPAPGSPSRPSPS